MKIRQMTSVGYCIMFTVGIENTLYIFLNHICKTIQLKITYGRANQTYGISTEITDIKIPIPL